MAINYGDYTELNLQKNECYSCKNEFITGVEISQKTGMICPFCGSRDTSWTAMSEDDNIQEYLGGLSLMIETDRLDFKKKLNKLLSDLKSLEQKLLED